MTQLLAVPKQGLTPRDPRTQLIVPAEGVLVAQHDPYWEALARFGDVDLREVDGLDEAQAKQSAAPEPSPVGNKTVAEPVSAPPAPAVVK